MCGTPSILFGRRWPWKWIPVDSSRLFLKMARTWSPSTTSSRAPGHVPLKPRASTAGSTASIWWLILSTLRSKTFTPPSRRGASGWLPAPGTLAYSPSRNRLTVARAWASWSTGTGLPDGATDAVAWSALAAGRLAAGFAKGCPAPVAGGGFGPKVHVGAPAAGTQATATLAATSPPPASAACRRKRRRVTESPTNGRARASVSVFMAPWSRAPRSG